MEGEESFPSANVCMHKVHYWYVRTRSPAYARSIEWQSSNEELEAVGEEAGGSLLV